MPSPRSPAASSRSPRRRRRGRGPGRCSRRAPIVWISEVSLRRNPSLSASRIATTATSGRSSPSRSRLIPIRQSKTPAAEVRQDPDALERLDVRVQIAAPDADLARVLVSSSAIRLVSVVTRTRSPARRGRADFGQQVVHLPLHGPDLDDRVEQAGRPDDLLDDLAAGPGELLGGRASRRRTGSDRGRASNSVVGQRPVVERRREPEAVLDQDLLARAVAVVHPAHLRQRHVRLVHDEQEVAAGSSRAASAAARPGGAPRGGASSSRCRCSSRAP